MKKLIADYRLVSLISGLLIGITLTKIYFIIGWVCFVPFFIVLHKLSVKKHFSAGFLSGLAAGLISYWWMIPGAERFTGSSSFYGIAVYIIFSLLVGVYFGLVNLTFGYLKIKSSSGQASLLNALLAASVFTVWEALLMSLSNVFPWVNFHSGNPMVKNLYAIQPASVFGIHIISFIVVLVNFLIADCIIYKRYVQLWKPAVVAAAYMLLGFITYQANSGEATKSNSFKLAILCENIPPEVRWDSSSGNRLVQELIYLDKTATAEKPDMTLWSESAVPWTYRPDDDLVNEFLKISKPANITHLLGINTDFKDNVVYNSVYCLLPNGQVTGRYDKRYLLALIEAPFAGMVFPFFSSSGFLVEKGTNNYPVETPFGKAGVMICNESSVPEASASMVRNGAEFLCNLSNDGWFSDTYLADLHFYYARLRAVEARKDAAVNSNNGWCGFISSSGAIEMQERSDKPFVKLGVMHANSAITLASTIPFLWVYICVGFVIVVMIKKSALTKRQTK